jgi:hypothetical protein
MALTLADTGATAILESYLNKSEPSGGNNLTLKLYCNDVTPLDTHTPANFTEATGGGYAAKTLSAASWTVQTTGGIVEGVYADQTFTFTGPLTTNTDVYGYYVVDADNSLVWAEKRGATFTPTESGDNLTVRPKIQMSKGTPT